MAIGTPVAGNQATSGVGNSFSPVYPASIAPGDGVLLIGIQKPGTATFNTPAGFTLRGSLTGAGGYGATTGVDVGNTNCYIWSKDVVDGTEGGTTLSVTSTSNNSGITWLVKIPTNGGLLSYGNSNAQQSTTPTSSLSLTMAADPGFTSGDLAFWAMAVATDNNVPSFSNFAITASGATFATATKLNEPSTTTNNDISGTSAYAAVSSGTSSGAPTVTATLAGTLTNMRGPMVVVRVREGTPLGAGTTTQSDTSTSGAISQNHILGAGTTTQSDTSSSGTLPSLRDTHDLPTIRRKFKPEKVKNERKKLIEDIEQSIKAQFEPEPQIEAAKEVKQTKIKKNGKVVIESPNVDIDFTKAEEKLKLLKKQRDIDDDDAEIFLLLM